MFLAFVIKYWRLLLEATMLVTIVGMYECDIAKSNRVNATLLKGFVQQGDELAMEKAKNVSQPAIIAALPAPQKARAEKMIAAGGKIAESISETVAVSDAPKFEATKSATGFTYHDEYWRFKLFVTPDGQIVSGERSQIFKVTGTIFVGPDRSTRFADVDFREYSPKDGSEIPSAGTKMSWEFKQVNLPAPTVSPWHTRLVALAAPVTGVGLGAQWNPWKGAIVSLGGLYAPTPGVSGVAGLGWRLRLPFWDSTLGLSGSYVYGKTGGAVRPLGSAELSR